METAANQLDNKKVDPSMTAKATVDRVKYLVFALADESYGIPLSHVREVIAMTDITTIPHVPEYFKGLINLRGQIISVFDLRTQFRLPQTKSESKKTAIVIVEINGLTLGCIVDEVKEVASYATTQLDKKLDIQSRIGRQYIDGVARTEEARMVVLLKIEEILSESQIETLRKHSSK